jgi:alkanesulfonate monooxygenase SsuD/methylene tetrahydromethanopterin reductase-like flavin-dependent oxidoreductase (luciferase family)
LQPPVASLTNLMNEMSEEARFHVNQMTSCSFVGSPETLVKELKEFITYSRVDELMISSPIYNHEAKLNSLRLLKEVVDSI